MTNPPQGGDHQDPDRTPGRGRSGRRIGRRAESTRMIPLREPDGGRRAEQLGVGPAARRAGRDAPPSAGSLGAAGRRGRGPTASPRAPTRRAGHSRARPRPPPAARPGQYPAAGPVSRAARVSSAGQPQRAAAGHGEQQPGQQYGQASGQPAVRPAAGPGSTAESVRPAGLLAVLRPGRAAVRASTDRAGTGSSRASRTASPASTGRAATASSSTGRASTASSSTGSVRAAVRAAVRPAGRVRPAGATGRSPSAPAWSSGWSCSACSSSPPRSCCRWSWARPRPWTRRRSSATSPPSSRSARTSPST